MFLRIRELLSCIRKINKGIFHILQVVRLLVSKKMIIKVQQRKTIYNKKLGDSLPKIKKKLVWKNILLRNNKTQFNKFKLLKKILKKHIIINQFKIN